MQILTQRQGVAFFSLLLATLFIFVGANTLQADSSIISQDRSGGIIQFTQHDVAPNPAMVGEIVTYTIGITNTSSTATVMVTETLPAELSYLTGTFNVTPDMGSYGVVGNVITWTGVISINTGVDFSFSASVDAESTTYEDSFVVYESGGNTVTSTVVLNQAIIDLSNSSKLVDNEEITVGSILNYTLTIENSGNVTATNAMLTDTLPLDLLYQANSLMVTPDVGTYGYSEGTISWNGDLAPDEVVTLEFSAIVDNTASVDDVITNEMTVTAGDEMATDSASTTVVEEPANIVAFTKTARDTVSEGGSIQYTVVISNAGLGSAVDTTFTDALPDSLDYVSGSFSVNPSVGDLSVTDDVISWIGTVPSESDLTIVFYADLSDTVEPGDVITNTAGLEYDGAMWDATAVTHVTENALYLPIMIKSLPEVQVAVSRPNANNEWTVSWGNAGTGVTYRIQQSQTSDFNDVTEYTTGQTSQAITGIAPALNNTYYYRVRGEADGVAGPWSATVSVVGGYRDNFDDPSSGWAMRRTTYLEQTEARYGSGGEAGNLIIIVGDRWDWMIASPLVEAPEPPYAIEYRSRIHDSSNLVSGGAVVGGDWNGEACPHIGNVYRTDHCFNQFYAFNYIFYGPIKLLYERVDELVWCPSCGQSPIKRIGSNNAGSEPVVANNDNGKEWHTYRMEVRADQGIDLYVDGRFIRNFPDTRYLANPYFGVFASTDEYEPSIWFYDYYQVTYLDE